MFFFGQSFFVNKAITEIVYFYDTFTASDGTLLFNHTSDNGKNWFVSPVGIGTAQSLVIYNNKVRKPTYAEDPDNSSGEARYTMNVNVPIDNQYFIECKFSMTSMSEGQGYTILYFKSELATGYSNHILLSVDNAGSITIYSSATGASTNGTFVQLNNIEQTLRLYISNGYCSLQIDGQLIGQLATPGLIPNRYDMTLFGTGGLDIIQVNSVKIAAGAGPAMP